MTAREGGFRLITVTDDEEELVVHAGSGRQEPRAAQPVAEPSATPGAADAKAPAETAAAPAESARQQELRRRAEELAQAEAGLQDPHAFSRMRAIVLIALAALIIAFVVYLVALH